MNKFIICIVLFFLVGCTEEETDNNPHKLNPTYWNRAEIMERYTKHVQRRNKTRAIIASDAPPAPDWNDTSVRFSETPYGYHIKVVKDHMTGKECILLCTNGGTVIVLKRFE